LETKRKHWKQNGNVGNETANIGSETEGWKQNGKTLEVKQQKAKKTEKVLSPLTNTQDSSFIGNP